MKDSDLYETPPEIFDWANTIFDFTLDVCAQDHTAQCDDYLTPKENALLTEWGERNWCNPPYSCVLPWVMKAILESEKRNRVTCMLVRHDPSTEWFQTAIKAGAKVWDIPFRIRFFLNGKRQGTYNFPCCFLIFLPEMRKGTE